MTPVEPEVDVESPTALLTPPPMPVADPAPDSVETTDGRPEKLITAAVVAASCLFIFWQMQPELIFTDSTPTGGDMGAHVWGPAFLRDELLPRGQLTGWTPDWYSGFPAFHFYMVIPSLAIVLLDVGLHPILAGLSVVGLGAALYRVWTRPELAHRRTVATIGAIALALLLIPFPYNVAFKLIAISGVVLFPLGAWALGHLGGLRFPGPAFLALASLAFAFDRSFNIYGGNIASTLAGEFAASISLTLSLIALGFVIRGTRTGEYKAAAAATIALTGLSHLLPAFFLLTAVAVLMVLRLAQKRFRAVPWILLSGVLAAFTSAFWVLPFFLRTDYLNDMGWERIELLHSPLITRSKLNPSNVLSDYPPFTVLLLLGIVGLVLSLIKRVELGVILGATAALMAGAFVWFPDGRLWNARILPFYYLSVGLLAGLGLALAVQMLAKADFIGRAVVIITSAGLLLIPAVRAAWVWPEPTDISITTYAGNVALYAIRIYATTAFLVALFTEIPRQLHQVARQSLIGASIVALGVLLASPFRDVGFDNLRTIDGFVWGLVGLIALVVVSALIISVAIESFELLRSKAAEPNRVGTAEFEEQPGISTGSVEGTAAERFEEQPGISTGSVEGTAAERFEEQPGISTGSVEGTAAERFEEQPGISTGSVENYRAERDPLSMVLRSAPVIAAGMMFILLGLALNVVGGTEATDLGRSWTVLGQPVITSNDDSFVPGWARWNFSGLQTKGRNDGAIGDVGKGGWQEYEYVQRTMTGVGEEVGCGRAMWEFAPELNRYGTTMAMMLLPMWTDGCIGSMEGLYFEATPTVPYHFLLQSDLSGPSREVGGTSQRVGGPSQAMRDLPYGTFDIDRGVDRLHELGVRYYLAFAPQTVEAARAHPQLTEVTTASPWVVFETTATLVEPLSSTPVVIDGVRNHQDQWLNVGVEWFQTPTTVRPASSGPDEWRRVDAAIVVDRYEAPDTKRAGAIGPEAQTMAELLPNTPVEEAVVVSDVSTDTDTISFSVDQIGEPVLVRASYFPNWTADGADGPYRVAPNFMVVVPTENDVVLQFKRQGVDWIAIALTVAGLVGIGAVGNGRRKAAT